MRSGEREWAAKVRWNPSGRTGVQRVEDLEAMQIRCLLLAIAVTLAGCAPAASSPTMDSPLSPPITPAWPPVPSPAGGTSPLPTPAGPSPSAPIRPTDAPAVPRVGATPAPARAVDDLAARLGADPALIELVSVTRQEMPLRFLGCPPPGVRPRFDQPAMVLGEEILLRAGGVEHVYHAHGVQLVYCGPR
jgi:hypothetical protein